MRVDGFRKCWDIGGRMRIEVIMSLKLIEGVVR